VKPREIIFLVGCSLAAVAALGLASGQWQAVGLGVALGFAGGLYGLAKIREALLRVPSLPATAGQNAVLGALVGTLLGRMILLGAGLALGLGVLKLTPLWIVIAFFCVYVTAQVLEIRLALSTREIQPAES